MLEFSTSTVIIQTTTYACHMYLNYLVVFSCFLLIRPLEGPLVYKTLDPLILSIIFIKKHTLKFSKKFLNNNWSKIVAIPQQFWIRESIHLLWPKGFWFLKLGSTFNLCPFLFITANNKSKEQKANSDIFNRIGKVWRFITVCFSVDW